MSVHSLRPGERAAVALAALRKLRAQAAVLGASERLADDAAAYLAAVEFFRAEGFEPRWRSDDPATSLLSLHALDGPRISSVAAEGVEG